MITKSLFLKKVIKHHLLILCLMFFSLSITGCSQTEEKQVSRVETMLGVSIPSGVEDIQVVKVSETSEYTKPYTIYIRAKMSAEMYNELVKALELTMNSEEFQNQYTVLLLSQFQPKRSTPNWWNLDNNARINEYSGAGKFLNAENDGWIISTYQNGYAYFKAYEEGEP